MLWALGGVALTRVDGKKYENLLYSSQPEPTTDEATVAGFASNNNTH